MSALSDYLDSITDNTTNLLPLADYGIKISKAGFEAVNGTDNDLLYNSSWPSIQIVKVVATPTWGDVVSHGLEFPPLAILTGGSNSIYGRAMEGLTVDDTNVYVPSANGGESANDGSVIIYNVDITRDVDYPYTDVASENVDYIPDYGVKMVKSGLDIESTDMRDYILHSRCGSPLVLAVKTQETVSPDNPTLIKYTNNLGYPTFNMGWVGMVEGTSDSSSGGHVVGANAYTFAPQQSQAFPQTRTDGIRAVVIEVTDDRASLVVLRSPMFATTNAVEVNY